MSATHMGILEKPSFMGASGKGMISTAMASFPVLSMMEVKSYFMVILLCAVCPPFLPGGIDPIRLCAAVLRIIPRARGRRKEGVRPALTGTGSPKASGELFCPYRLTAVSLSMLLQTEERTEAPAVRRDRTAGAVKNAADRRKERRRRKALTNQKMGGNHGKQICNRSS